MFPIFALIFMVNTLFLKVLNILRLIVITTIGPIVMKKLGERRPMSRSKGLLAEIIMNHDRIENK